MKTAIVYYSKHHGNTKKLVDAIASGFEVTLIDAAENAAADLMNFDCIGFASGITSPPLPSSSCPLRRRIYRKARTCFLWAPAA